MGSDMIVALKEASANRTTLFGVNHHAAPNQRHAVQIVPGQMHDMGELVPIPEHEVPQAKRTFSALGLQPTGQWGFVHGVNEHRVAIGVTDWQSRLRDGVPAISGADLTRLCLERSHCRDPCCRDADRSARTPRPQPFRWLGSIDRRQYLPHCRL